MIILFFEYYHLAPLECLPLGHVQLSQISEGAYIPIYVPSEEFGFWLSSTFPGDLEI